jgi:hypothetical protein
MRRYPLLAACAVGATLATAVVTSAASAADGDPITADIYVAIDLPDYGSSGPMVWQYTDVPVTDGVELPSGSAVTSNPTGWCGDAYVDIAADLSTVTYGGGDHYCDFETAEIVITLHNGTFAGDPVIVSDALFQDVGDTTPKVQSATVSEDMATFTANWAGSEGVDADMSGQAVFQFGTVDDGDTDTPADDGDADPASPVVADPTFTG